MDKRTWTGEDLNYPPDECYPLAPPFPTKVQMLEAGECYAPSRGAVFKCSRLKGHTGRHAAYGVERVRAVWE